MPWVRWSGQASFAAQLLQRLAAVGAQAHDLLDVVARARRRAFAQELQAPEPLAHVCPDAEEQRRIFLAEPLQHLERRARIGPGFGVADRDLAAAGETGFGSRSGLPVACKGDRAQGRCPAILRESAVIRILSLDHSGSAQKHRLGNRHAKGVGGLEIDRELELRRLLDRQIGGPRPFEDSMDIYGGLAQLIRRIRN
jgi:hypothetical protein